VRLLAERRDGLLLGQACADEFVDGIAEADGALAPELLDGS
jgi:hypothetical protein